MLASYIDRSYYRSTLLAFLPDSFLSLFEIVSTAVTLDSYYLDVNCVYCKHSHGTCNWFCDECMQVKILLVPDWVDSELGSCYINSIKILKRSLIDKFIKT